MDHTSTKTRPASANGDVPPDGFALAYDRHPGPYLRFLGRCLGAHGVGTLVRLD